MAYEQAFDKIIQWFFLFRTIELSRLIRSRTRLAKVQVNYVHQTAQMKVGDKIMLKSGTFKRTENFRWYFNGNSAKPIFIKPAIVFDEFSDLGLALSI